jgi:hypothetical protein
LDEFCAFPTQLIINSKTNILASFFMYFKL